MAKRSSEVSLWIYERRKGQRPLPLHTMEREVGIGCPKVSEGGVT